MSFQAIEILPSAAAQRLNAEAHYQAVEMSNGTQTLLGTEKLLHGNQELA